MIQVELLFFSLARNIGFTNGNVGLYVQHYGVSMSVDWLPWNFVDICVPYMASYFIILLLSWSAGRQFGQWEIGRTGRAAVSTPFVFSCWMSNKFSARFHALLWQLEVSFLTQSERKREATRQFIFQSKFILKHLISSYMIRHIRI